MPRFLSWTQLDTLERSENDYIRYYILREPKPSSIYMDFGKKMADAIELGELTGEPLLDLAISQLPMLEIAEHEASAIYRADYLGDIPLLAQMDTAKKDLTEFNEFKTSKNPWTQFKVDRHGQLTFYATVIWLAVKRRPEKIRLAWVETEYDGAKVEATGRVEVFETARSTNDILSMCVRIRKAWRRIKELREQYDNDTEKQETTVRQD